MRISDWSSDVCSSDLTAAGFPATDQHRLIDPTPAPRIERGDVMSIFSHFQQRFESTRQEEYSLQEYLDLCKQDRSAYASAAERLLLAIGEPELLDTSANSRLSRIFSNKVIRRYPTFQDFHGTIGRAHVCTPVT